MKRNGFWGKVEKQGGDGCWLWTGYTTPKGYGSFGAPGTGKIVRAHRYAYELLVGPIPKGLQLDHLCRVRNCVNPAHLEPVTNRENCMRGLGVLHQAAKTHCPQGHPYDTENTLVSCGRRLCRACRRPLDRIRQQARRDRAKAERAAS